MFKDTVCSFGRACFHTLPGKRKEGNWGKSWRLSTCARHWKLPSLSSTTPTSEIIDLHFLLFISELGDISDITSLYSSHLLTLHLFLFIALSLSRQKFSLAKSPSHTRDLESQPGICLPYKSSPRKPLYTASKLHHAFSHPLLRFDFAGCESASPRLKSAPSPLSKSTQC
jgi:hypothetical protein